MRLIRKIRIEGFRSIADESMPDLGEHVVLVGKNSSGKSNVLRALSLFFNGETNPGLRLDFYRDLHFRPTRRQKKQIRIEVTFDIPNSFNFRSGLEHAKALGKNFSISRTWSLDRQRNINLDTEVLIDGKNEDVDEQVARDFLSLIVFRYIPNRTVPAEMLRDESQTVAAAIFKKLKEADKAADVLKGLTASAGRLLAKTSDALDQSGASISSPNIATAGSLGEMLRMSGFQATGLNGVPVRDEDWGAGHQAFFLLNLLKEIDTDYSRQFGWRQACVWAVEEPESGLHHDLQSRLARQLIEWSQDSRSRLQIFTTTHSPILTMSGDKGYWVEVGDTSSSISGMSIPDLVRSAEEGGVASYLHPVLSFPFNPVVLVEGPIDERVLNHVASILGRGALRFLSLPSLESGEGSGVDSQISYVRKNSPLIHKRPKESPFLVLVDWDVSDSKFNQLKSVYGSGADRYVLRAPVELCNPDLGKSFKGIERFYPSRIIRDAHNRQDIAVAFPSAEGLSWSVSSDELSRSKSALLARLLRVTNLAELGKLARLVEYVHSASTSVATDQLRLIP